jgi:hypothetical protein
VTLREDSREEVRREVAGRRGLDRQRSEEPGQKYSGERATWGVAERTGNGALGSTLEPQTFEEASASLGSPLGLPIVVFGRERGLKRGRHSFDLTCIHPNRGDHEALGELFLEVISR